MWDSKTGDLLHTICGVASHTVSNLSVAVYGGLLCVSRSSELRLYRLESCGLQRELFLHKSPITSMAITSTGVLVSASTKLCLTDLRCLVRYGVLITKTGKGSVSSSDKILTLKPWIDFVASVLNLVVTAAQLGSFAFGPKTPTPPAVNGPAQVVHRISTFGLPVSFNNVEFVHVFIPTILLTMIFFITFIAQEAIEVAKFLQPNRSLFKYSFLAADAFCSSMAKVGLIPVLEVLAWPLVPYGLNNWMSLLGLLTTVCFVGASMRLALVDFKLARLDVRFNVLDWRGDHALAINQRDRDRTHPLSCHSQKYEIAQIVFKVAMRVGSMLLVGSSWFIAGASFRLVSAIMLGATGLCYDRFFPRQHTSSRQQSSSGCRVAFDLNSVQSAFDAGIITMYAASLAAAITFSQGGEKALESIWLSYMPLFVVPNAVIGYHARILYRRICPRRKSAGIKPEEDDHQH